MNVLHFCLLFLSLTLTYHSNAISILSDIETFYKWFHMTAEFVNNALHLYDEVNDEPFEMDAKEKRLFDSLKSLTYFINRVETNIPQVTIAKFNQMERDFSQIIHFEIKLDYLVKQIDRIEDSYQTFLSLQKKLKSKLDNSTDSKAVSLKWIMEDFAKSVVTMQGDSIRSSLSAIHDMIDMHGSSSFYNKNDIFTLILNNFNDKTASRCIIDKSPQQLIFDTLTSFRLIQLKGLAMIEYSYIILRLYTGGDFRDFMSEFRSEMMQRFNKQADIAMSVITQADNSYWRCDPNRHVPEQTYTQITRLLQGYVHNEKELSHKDSCFEGCDYYTYENRPKCSHADKLCRSQPTCDGRVFDCKFVKEDMHICFSSPGSTRRYDYIQWGGGPNYGHSERSCTTGLSYIEKFRKLLLWRCLYCFCFCDAETNSDRYFSLEEMTSDVESNKVVIGVRFTKENRTFHLQIKQAKLLPMGIIDNTSMSWVNLPQFSLSNWLDKPKYHKLTYESRSFDLDELIAPKNYIITGVRMRVIGSHLNVEIRLTAFDFKSGQLYQNLTYWKGNDNTDATDGSSSNRLEHDLSNNKRLPIEASNDRHSPDSQPNTYIKFQPSDENTDAAQSTVPFIDIQAVTPNPPVPLVGLGIIHKGALTSAGYIEPKVYTLNLAEYSLVRVNGNDEITTIAPAA